MSPFPRLVLLFLATACAATCGAACASGPREYPSPTPSRPVTSAATPRPPGGSGEPGGAGAVAPDRTRSYRIGAEVRVPHAASGRYAVVGGHAAARPGRGETAIRYLVEVEDGLPFDAEEFAADVHRTLNDPRGWAPFRRVDHGPVRVRVALSSPATTDRECRPLRTGGDLSCWNGRRSVINALRWATGVPQYEGDLAAYREYLISHEVGHGLGHRHASCPGSGRPAPVMAQQSKSLGRCRPNPWPYPERERRDAR
ncbi:DUF3152 domain-containing protein [Nonomuraea sp. NN258]|uniref:DUF3152 domain-containing protein n=1 Tax=Nonomuraea antri TaxID=2730852 RepID=UPI001568C459|nr:DUF3152 domain-containing protein [Nonomuraea antri]NRQ39424.1 DUF3152 domain-containing protein [Nonomuraea antri]